MSVTTSDRTIEERFAACAAEGRAALVVYTTAGFPRSEQGLETLVALADAGADVLELGVPFSDPLADGFDAGTSRRSYQSTPWLPDAVLKEMRDNPERGFDPLLVKAFVSLTGIYPVGSVVILDSYELAVVVAPSTKPESYHQPVVKVIYDDLGIPVDPPRLVDLTDTDPATGEPVRTIIKTTDPEKYGIRVRDYVV